MSLGDAKDHAHQALLASPSIVAIAVTRIFEISPERWLTYCGIAFLVLQAAHRVWQWRRDIRRERKGLPPAPLA